MSRFSSTINLCLLCIMNLSAQHLLTLDNGLLQTKILHPSSGYYQGARFETAGFIHELRRGSINVTGYNYQGQRDPLSSDQVCGNAEEFTLPLKDAEGMAFLKIGNGIFQDKPEQPYDSNAHYDCLKRFAWQLEKTPDSVSFTQTIPSWHGYAYIYRKTFRLWADKPVLEISYSLQNTGTQSIKTFQYAHNFTSLNRTLPVGTCVTWEDDLVIRPKRPNPPYVWQGSKLTLNRPSRSFFTFLDFKPGRHPVIPKVTIDFPTGAQLVIQDHFKPAWMAFHMGPDYLCPETFIPIHLQPGDTQTWTRSYELHEKKPTLVPSAEIRP